MNIRSVKIECDNHDPHVMYVNSHWFFAYIDVGSSKLIHFISLPPGEKNLRPTFRAGDRMRVDGDLYTVMNYQLVAFPLVSFDPDLPPLTSTFVFVYQLISVLDTSDIYPSKWWIEIPGETYRIPDNDLRLLQVFLSLGLECQ